MGPPHSFLPTSGISGGPASAGAAFERQAELIRGLEDTRPAAPIDPAYLAQVMAAMRQLHGKGAMSPDNTTI